MEQATSPEARISHPYATHSWAAPIAARRLARRTPARRYPPNDCCFALACAKGDQNAKRLSYLQTTIHALWDHAKRQAAKREHTVHATFRNVRRRHKHAAATRAAQAIANMRHASWRRTQAPPTGASFPRAPSGHVITGRGSKQQGTRAHAAREKPVTCGRITDKGVQRDEGWMQ